MMKNHFGSITERIPPHQFDEVKKHLKEMLEIGVIQKSQSPWVSALSFWYAKKMVLSAFLNRSPKIKRACTIKDAQTLPWIEDSLNSLNGASDIH